MMRRNAPRSEDDYYYFQAPLVSGSAASNVGADKAAPDTVAVLWIPDPEQRRSFREYYVAREVPKPKARPIGFGKH